MAMFSIPIVAIKHNDLCESCGTPGDLLCCDTCNLVFHLHCYRPVLIEVPDGSWSCCFCIVNGNNGAAASSERHRMAKHSAQEILQLKAAAKERDCDHNISPIQPNEHPLVPLLLPILFDNHHKANIDETDTNAIGITNNSTSLLESCVLASLARFRVGLFWHLV